MKSTLLILTLLAFFTGISAQEISPDYDSVLASSLGADDLGMKTYVLVILKTGNAVITDTAVRAQLFRGHFANINKLAEEGKMLTAGPMDANDQQYRGIFLFDTGDINEAKELLKGDPTVVQGIFEPLFFLWYGSAAFGKVPEIHRMIQKRPVE